MSDFILAHSLEILEFFLLVLPLMIAMYGLVIILLISLWRYLNDD